MQHHYLVAIVSLLALILYIVMGLRVGRGRSTHGIAAPAMTGNEDFERLVRIQANTLEWLPIFLVSLWLFGFSWDDRVAAGLGVIWIIGRTLYMTGYAKAANQRSMGFMIQSLTTLVLLLGALGKIIYDAIQNGV